MPTGSYASPVDDREAERNARPPPLAVHTVGRYEGTLYYVRSVVAENSAWDLLHYRDEDGVFPNHSTFDQFFDDQKFEAYRRLGMWAASSALGMAADGAVTNGAARLQLEEV